MSSWTQIQTPAQCAEYFRLLQSSSDAYAETTLDGLKGLLEDRKGVAYLYRNSEPADFYLLFLLTPSPSENGTWKLVHIVPVGEYNPLEAFKIISRKIRSVFDQLGVTRYYGRPLKEYSNPQVSEFYKRARERSWELIEVEDRPGHIAYTFHFYRDPTRTNEDELFTRSNVGERNV